MKVYVVNHTLFIFSPHEIEVTNKVFTKKEDAYKCFNDLISEARIAAYEFDNGQGELRNDECFEMLVDEMDYEVQITIEVVNLE
ncbi:hypothetical protein [Clostridium sp. D43t1_170807_H7]|uniref:hypothetical protein n=1 Tax=Clostridium sp. D43t1_170807_H7 TaxID=2787140 RepID=UPI00189BFBA0|nr:hypothetical protein [Clostridium sp. D43t1_170807_H7]